MKKQEEKAVILDTKAGIEYANWAGLKYHLRIEMAGMTHRLGRLRPKLAPQLGLKARAPYEDFIAAIEKKMSELIEQNQKEAAEKARSDAYLAIRNAEQSPLVHPAPQQAQ